MEDDSSEVLDVHLLDLQLLWFRSERNRLRNVLGYIGGCSPVSTHGTLTCGVDQRQR
jgi:hypothetical protein